ncbi:TetR/AcrR family transcriptional regulator [Phyllobacterium sp. 22229]|uniref:TetR/AcrR family transcriptional regulator n=1 Tax=Agrobacterium radiobacter TaxID=362 RepID=A0ABD5LRJ4_AGRRD
MAGRPREFDTDAAIHKIRNVFWEKGFDATTMLDLIGATDVASASLYSTFGSKIDMFRKAIVDYNTNEGGFAARALTEEPHARDAIARMLTDAVMLFTNQEQPRGCMIVSSGLRMGAGNDELLKWLSEQRTQRLASVFDRLRRGQEAGEISQATDISSLADFLTTVLQGLSIQAEDGMGRERLLGIVEQTMKQYDIAVS